MNSAHLRNKPLFFWPTAMYSRADCAKRNSGQIARLCDRHAFVSVFNDVVVSFVAALLLAARPTTVFLRVVSVVVPSVKRHARWPHAHVVKKILKGFFPSLANADPSPSVIKEFVYVRVATASDHCCPNSVLSTIFTTLGKSVFCGPRCSNLSIEASTAFSKAPDQRPSANSCKVSANTSASPIRVFTSNVRSFENKKSSERFSNNVFVGFCHGF